MNQQENTIENNAKNNPEFETVLEYLKHNRGFDFTGYKRASLMRRIQKRMQVAGLDSYSAYRDYLEVHPDEFVQLFNTILINVTSFFRDTAAWEYIAGEIMPRILSGKQPDDAIRVWCAGTASGQEAYTIAMLLAEALGMTPFRERVKIYASDVDEEALNQARQATYGAREIADVPPHLLEKYFECVEDRYVFNPALRRNIIFGRHDLVQDAPISRVDLLICRNTLMYFNSETQAKILLRFHFALRDSGFLFLGKAEMLFTHANLFTPVDGRLRIFAKKTGVDLRHRLLMATQSEAEADSNNQIKHLHFHEAAFDNSPVAQIVLDAEQLMVLANERARTLFNLTSRELHRALPELELSYRIQELRAGIAQSAHERRPVVLKEVSWTPLAGEARWLDVLISPLLDVNSRRLGTSIAFTDVTRYKKLQQEIEHANQELETAYEELQSTNEELETMNEELQSTNEELYTINEELRRRTDDLNEANSFLDDILTSMSNGIVVVNRDCQIRVWSRKVEDLWGLRRDEVLGMNFLNLDIGLPTEQLRQPIRDTLSSPEQSQEITLDAINRRGRALRCKVVCSPLMGEDNSISGVTLLMEEAKAAPPGL